MITTRNVALLAAAVATLVLCSMLTVSIDVQAIVAAHDWGGLTVAIAGVAALNPQALREAYAKLTDEMKAMIATAEGENRDFTDEEVKTFDAKKAEADKLKIRIDRMVDANDREAALNAPVPAAARGQGVQPPRRPNEAKTEFEDFGEFLSAVRFNPNDQRLRYMENPAAIDPETGQLRAEFRMDNQTSGGFMVPNQLRQTVMRVEPQAALVRPRAQVIPAGDPPDAGVTMGALDQTGTAPGNMFGGMTMSWIGEGDEKPETDAKLREITLTPHEIAGTAVITDKMLRNWQAAKVFIENLMRGAVNSAEDYAYLRGDGVAKPLGVVNAGATKWINRAGANHIAYADLVNMVARLLMRDGVSPVWSMPQSALVDITTMTDPEGHYIWKPDARDGFAGTLLGFPVRWNNRAPALGAKGDTILADWSYYLIKDGSGPFVAASEHVLFRQNKTVFKIFWNVDGAPWLTAPIKEENGYDVSPFVGLDIPA